MGSKRSHTEAGLNDLTYDELIESLVLALGKDREIKSLLRLVKKQFMTKENEIVSYKQKIEALLEEVRHTSHIHEEDLRHIKKMQLEVKDLEESELNLCASIKESADKAASTEGKIEAAKAIAHDMLCEVKSQTEELRSETKTVASGVSSSFSPIFSEDVKRLVGNCPVTTALFDELIPAFNAIQLKKDAHKYEFYRWLIIASFIAANMPFWRSRIAYIMEKSIISCREASGAAKLAQRLLPGTLSYSEQLKCEGKELDLSLLQDPTFDLDRYMVVFVYDNIQLQHARTTESGAGGVSESSKVTVRTMRIALQFNNPKWAALQRDYNYNPKRMSQQFPLKDVPLSALDISSTYCYDNPQKHSDADYIDCEVLAGFELAAMRVLVSGVNVHEEKRGRNHPNSKGMTKPQKPV